MTQADFGTIDPTTTSGTQLANLLNQFRDGQNSNHSGSTRPTYAVANMLWVEDVSSTIKRINIYDGAADIAIGTYDTSTDTWSPVAPTGVPINMTDLTVTESVNLAGNIDGIVSGTVNNWNPTNFADAFQINATTTTSATITGITAGTPDGRTILLTTTTGNITLAHDNAGSVANARIEISGNRDLILNAGDSVLLRWELGRANWATVGYIRAQRPPGHKEGLILSNFAVDLEHDISVTAGSCRSDDDTADIILPAALEGVRMDTTFSDANNGGLRATETLPISGTVHFFLVDNPNSSSITPKLLGSISINPTLPTGYTVKRRVGSFVTNANANFRRTFQTGPNRFELEGGVGDVQSGSYGTNVLQALSVPGLIRVKAIMSAAISHSSSIAGGTELMISSTSQNITAAANGRFIVLAFGNNGRQATLMEAVTNLSSQVRVVVSQSGTGITIIITTLGWEDLSL